MEDLRIQREKENSKFLNLYYKILFFSKKHKWRILRYSIILFIIIFPQLSGKLIGTWISDFFGNILKYTFKL